MRWATCKDRVGCRGLRPGTLPHHRTCGFPHTAVGPLGVLPSRSRGRVASEHSDGLGAFRVRPVVSQSRVVTVVVTPRCFVLSLAIPSSASVGSVRSFGPSLETPFCSCVPLTLLWPLLTSRSLSTPGSPRVSACSFRSRLWALQHAVSDSWASLVLACSPPTSCLTAHLCSFGRTFASRPFAPAPCGDDLAVRLRLASQAPGGNLSTRETRHLPGTRAQPSGCRAHKLRTVSSSRTRRHVAHFCSLKAALLCRGCRQRPLGAGLALLPGEDPVRFFEAFLGADVIPEAGHLPGIDGQPLVEPLNEPAGLVRVVALGYVLFDQRQRGLGIEIKRDAGQGAGRVLRLLLEEGDAPFAVQVDGIVL